MRGLAHSFRCGDRVYDPVDPRHIGTIVMIDSGIWARVQWDPPYTYLFSDLRLTKLEKINNKT